MSKIYFIKPIDLVGPIKIGMSRQPSDRLRTLSVWSPFPLEIIGSIPGGRSDEMYIHDCFADVHSHREWFHATDELRRAIVEILAAGSLEFFRNSYKPKKSLRPVRPSRTWTEDQRRLASYWTRVLAAESRVRCTGYDVPCRAPPDIRNILGTWRGACVPSSADIQRLEDFIENPAAFVVSLEQNRRPRGAA